MCACVRACVRARASARVCECVRECVCVCERERAHNSSTLIITKNTKGGRTFSYLAPKLWNSLPDNVRGSDTLSV